MLACSAAPPQVALQPAPISAAVSFVRAIAPFPVLDRAGTPYLHPFLGGFDVPRPHFIDIDGDGDLDLFVQERSNELMFFENTGNASAPTYAWRTDKYQNLEVGEWTRFVDLDADGDLDLLAEQPFSHVRVYRNQGGARQAAFEVATDSLRDGEGKAIFADRQNIPQIVDIDCDQLLDLFIGRVEGTITHYEEVPGSRSSTGVPRFAFQTERWEGIEIVAQMGPGMPSLHGANTMYFADHDRDADLDLFWGDFFEDGVLLIQNTGSCGSPSLRSTPTPILVDGAKVSTSGYNVPVLVDIDADKDLDLFIGVLGGAFNPNRTSADNFYSLQRNASGEYELRTRRFLSMIEVGNESVPALGDIDGDGDLDLLIGNKLEPGRQQAARLYVFRNNGTTKQPSFALADTVDLATAFHYAPALADLDSDSDLDLVLGTWNNGVQFYRNDGTRQLPHWVQDTTATLQLTRGSNSIPALGDLDGDGDLDLLVGEASGQLNYFRNTGSARAAKFELVSDEYEGIDVGRRSHPVLIDLDGDGDLDLISGSESGPVMYFRNTGTKQTPKFVADATFALALPAFSAPAFADLDGDGDVDLISGSLSGGLLYFERR